MFMKALSLVLALIMLLFAGACSGSGIDPINADPIPESDSSRPADEEGPRIVTGTPVGFSSEQELIAEFIACCNSGEVSDRFLNAFDSDAFLAYWMCDDSFAPDFAEAYCVYADRSKGAAYIMAHDPAFSDAWAKNVEDPMTDETLQAYFVPYQADLLQWFCPSYVNQIVSEWNGNAEAQQTDREEYLVMRCSALKDRLFPEREALDRAFFAKWKSVFGETDSQMHAENVWHSDFGYSRYTIDVEDPEQYVTAINVVYTYRDGCYVWFLIHETA